MPSALGIFFYLLIFAVPVLPLQANEPPGFQELEKKDSEAAPVPKPGVSQSPSNSRYIPAWMRSFMGFKIPFFKKTRATRAPVRSIRLKMPWVKTQDDNWSCGINSSTRVLKYHGNNVTYDQLRDIRKKKFRIPLLNRLPFARGSVPLYQLGTRPGGVRDLLNIYRRGSRVETGIQLSRILQILRLKKPVIALIRPNDRTQKLPFGKTISLPLLHWIVISGFDEDQRKIYYYDTYANNERSYSYERFLQRWNWDHKLISVGLKFKPRTIVY